ncbi:hypothetical protein CRS_27410 [Chryseobacterium sp. ON_d1]|nr:hypothetical protein CRS_27410 [Chryseobacterium sp. ON_d1]
MIKVKNIPIILLILAFNTRERNTITAGIDGTTEARNNLDGNLKSWFLPADHGLPWSIKLEIIAVQIAYSH